MSITGPRFWPAFTPEITTFGARCSRENATLTASTGTLTDSCTSQSYAYLLTFGADSSKRYFNSSGKLVAEADVVIDCSDNFATRQAINAACVRHGKPLVAGAAIGMDGQLSVYDTRDPASPCYACIFPPDAVFEEVQCSTMGVFAPLVGIIGSVQAAEALKLLADIGSSLAGRLQMLDGRTMSWTEIRAPRTAGCPVCSDRDAGRSALNPR